MEKKFKEIDYQDTMGFKLLLSDEIVKVVSTIDFDITTKADFISSIVTDKSGAWVSRGEKKYKSFFWKSKEIARIHFFDWREIYPKQIQKVEVLEV